MVQSSSSNRAYYASYDDPRINRSRGGKSLPKKEETGIEKVEEFVHEKITWFEKFAQDHARKVGVVLFYVFSPVTWPVMLIIGFFNDLLKLREIFHLMLNCTILQLQLYEEILYTVNTEAGSLEKAAQKIVKGVAKIINVFQHPVTMLKKWVRRRLGLPLLFKLEDGKDYQTVYLQLPDDSQGANELIGSDDDDDSANDGSSDDTNKFKTGMKNGSSTSSGKDFSKGIGSSKSDDSGTASSINNEKHHHINNEKHHVKLNAGINNEKSLDDVDNERLTEDKKFLPSLSAGIPTKI